MRSFSTLLIAAVAALAGPSAQAQTRDGFFVGFGAGWGSASVGSDAGDADEREGSVTAHARVGTAIGDRTLAGVELNGWFDSEDDASLSLFNTTVALYFYPADSGLFVKGGAGLSRADFELGGDNASGIGWGLMAGLGYDFAISDSTAVTPMATFWYGKPGNLKLDGIEVLQGFNHNVVEVAVGITFY
ncbi:MAG TPA: outer membrane beta-barrel protein [Vicinamibacteria bacterium]|nr:outer membrane beta-barrel protein [Vicinamibacteria bacterium]